MELKNTFNGKVALVTGGGDGLGKALCLKLSEYGARVICTDKNLDSALNVINLIRTRYGEEIAEARMLDVTNLEVLKDLVEDLYFTYEKIDYLFNNAGITIGGEIRDLKLEHWRDVISINLFGLISCSSLVFKRMCVAHDGHIVNIASISGLTAYTALGTAYAVSKHGVVTFSRSLRLEALDFNVRVTTVCPGPISTSIGRNWKHVNSNDRFREHTVDFIRRGISPEIASQLILEGTARNKSLVIFPLKYNLYYQISRMFRFWERRRVLKSIRYFRSNYREC